MAFKTGLPLDQALRSAIDQAKTTKAYLQQMQSALAGSISGNQAVNWATVLRNAVTQFQASSAVPGIPAYAQSQYSDNTYDVAAEFAAMTDALNAILSWLTANIPSDAAYVQAGQLAWHSYTPAQTAQLLTLVNSALATID